MNPAINELLKTFLQKDSLQDCSVRELQQLADKYPFFSISHLILAQKLKAGKAEAFNAESQKASLYFHDPLLADQLLNEKGNALIEQKQQETELSAVQATAEAPSIVVEEATAGDKPVIESPVEIPTLPVESLIAPIEEPSSFVASETETDESLEQKTAIEMSTPDLMETEETMSPGTKESEVPASPVEIPVFKTEPLDIATAELSFQPYHTVDYFASQGIKFKEEEKPKDKFGQQLKSFTEWLKILKKAPAGAVTATVNAQSEQKIEQLAEYSLSDGDVVTEAMAEVWEKQGNPEKAIVIYHKLSLLNPSKSSYFAAKIEQLKNS